MELRLFFLLLLLQSCLPGQSQKAQQGACDPGYAFDAKTRSCAFQGQALVPPVNTLKNVQMMQDTDLVVSLTYDSTNSDFATSCTVGDDPTLLHLTLASACSCIGGYCTITLTPEANYKGMAQFYYSVSNQYGSSNKTLVSVTIFPVDQEPRISATIPDPITFVEDGTIFVVLGYTDREGDLATACEVTMASTTYAYASSCSCDSAGVCSVTLSGQLHQDTVIAGPQTFTYRVKTNDLWSSLGVGSYNILHVAHLPELLGAIQQNTVSQPIFPDVSPWTAVFEISYKDIDFETPPSCGIVAGSLNGVVLSACSCAAPDALTAIGKCTLSLDMAVGYHFKNSENYTFSFKYSVQDGGGVGAFVSSSTATTIVVGSGNQPAQVIDASTLDGSTVDIDEGTPTTVDGTTYDFAIDEGGEGSQISEYILLSITSGDVDIIPTANIIPFWGTTQASLSAATGSTWYDLGDGAVGSATKYISFEITPRKGQVSEDTVVPITVEFKNNLWTAAAESITFDVNVKLKKSKPTVRLRHYSTPLFYDKYANAPFCDDLDTDNYYEDCVRNHKPSIADPGAIVGISAQKKGAIYYDYVSGLRYVSSGLNDPTLWTPFITNCPFSSSRDEPGCLRYNSVTDQFLNCVGDTSPVDDEDIVPTISGSYFYDYSHDVCYISASDGDGGYLWQEYDLLPNTLYCGSAATQNSIPSDETITSKSQAGTFYYYGTGPTCYVAKWDEDDTPKGSWESITTRCQATLNGCYQVNCSEQSGAPIAGSILSSADEGSLYRNSDTGACYIAKWNPRTQSGTWLSYPGSCTPGQGLCRQQNCIGNGPPRGNLTQNEDMIPTLVGNYYYDYANDICYKSVGTTKNSWVIFGPGGYSENSEDLADLSGNENMDLVLKDLYIDAGVKEGRLMVTFDFLTNGSPGDGIHGYGNPTLFNNKRVRLFCNGVQLTPLSYGADSVSFFVDDDDEGTHYCRSTDSYRFKNIEVYFEPTKGAAGYGRSEVKMTLQNDQLIDEYDSYFSLIVYPIGATHQGWTGLKALGNKVNRSDVIVENLSVTLNWEDFVYSPGQDEKTPVIDPNISDYRSVLISGYNVYRRMANEEFRFDLPLNIIPVSPNELSFTDTIGNVSSVMGPPRSGVVYYYTIKGVDNLHGNLISAPDYYINTIRVIAPPNNQAFIHRWIVNKEVCQMMNQIDTIDEANNYRCSYAGPGETLPTGYAQGDSSYYDFGYDLLVDRQEAGCPYGGDANDDYISLSTTPYPDIADAIYYSRTDAVCSKYIIAGGVGWRAFNDLDFIGGDLTSEEADRTSYAELPPLVRISQESANSLCGTRSQHSLTTKTGTTAAAPQAQLPSRRDQMAYSAWNSGVGYTDADIEPLEQGLSLNASRGCNSTNADGLTGYSNQEVPDSGDFYSLPGSLSSTIRSVITGSNKTTLCVSRYGVQDAIGNVKEWTSDRIHCLTPYQCEGIYEDHPLKDVASIGGAAAVGNIPDYTGAYCPYSTSEQTSSVTNNTCVNGNCIGNYSPVGTIVPGAARVIFYDSLHDVCYVSTNTGINNWTTISLTNTCPISPDSIEGSCTVNCIGSAAPGAAPAINQTSSYYYDYVHLKCYKSRTSDGLFVDMGTDFQTLPLASPPAVLNGNSDMRTADPYFYSWGLDGLRGPCSNNLGVCSDTITGWTIDAGTYSTGYFLFPLGLPVSSKFQTLFNGSNVASSMLQIGGSQGISSAALHKDAFSINSDVVAGSPNNCGAFTTGGSYTSGSGAGRYTFDVYPCEDGSSAEKHIGDDIGFRCESVIPESFYEE